MIALRAYDDVDLRRAGDDLFSLSLRGAAGDRDGHWPLVLDLLEAAKLGIDLLRCLLADMAGVEDHHVGIFGDLGRAIADRRQQLRHAGGIVDVHLAAIGLDEELLHEAAGYTVRRAPAPARAQPRAVPPGFPRGSGPGNRPVCGSGRGGCWLPPSPPA